MTHADLRIYQGDDYTATVTVNYADGSPADLTNYSAKAQIRRSVADTATDIACSIACTVQPPNTVQLAITHAQAATLAGDYVWDLQLITPSPQSYIITIMSGRVRATQEVTRP